MSKLRTALERASARKDKSGAHDRRARSPALAHAGGDEPLPPSATALLDIALAPRIQLDEDTLRMNRVLSPDARHPAENAYRMLRTRLMQKVRSNGWRIIGVSSIVPNEGKTVTAINLSISIAAEIGQEAVLIDLDLRRPSVMKYLGIEPGRLPTLKDYLENRAQDLSELLVCPGIARLGCLLGDVPLERSSDLLASPRGKRLFQELRERLPRETIVIVDLPPLFAADDALAIAPMLDGLLLVIAPGSVRRDEVADARELLQEFNIIGTLLNKSVDKDRRKYYY